MNIKNGFQMKKILFLCGILFLLLIGCSNQTNGKKQNAQEALVDSSKLSYDTARFDLEPDIRLFTVLAFANGSGYDYENTVMTRERLELRHYLDSILPPEYKDQIAGTYKATDGGLFAYVGGKAFNLSMPPAFSWLPEAGTLIVPYYRKDEKFASQVKEFYLKANIPALWNKYYPDLKKTNYKYAPYTDKAIKDIIQFCRVDKNYFDSIKIHFNVFPFMQNESGFTCSSKKDIYLIVSPRKTLPGPDAFYHEALHHIINPMVEKNKFSINDNITSIGKGNRSNYYSTGDGLFAESMVRTIDYILREKYYGWSKEETLVKINDQYGYGLILMPYFYEKLKVYSEDSVTLEKYLPEIISQIDIEKEKQRWNSFKAQSTDANVKLP